MSNTLTPARAISPGRILQRELDARAWTQKDLAEITNRPAQTINEIIKGTKQITPETARELSAALGTTAEFWTNLETNYRLNLAKKKQKEEEIERRSRLYTLAPISELIKRLVGFQRRLFLKDKFRKWVRVFFATVFVCEYSYTKHVAPKRAVQRANAPRSQKLFKVK
jgi:addiction module HigA family antidote